jgi:hypothetical protein
MDIQSQVQYPWFQNNGRSIMRLLELEKVLSLKQWASTSASSRGYKTTQGSVTGSIPIFR